MILRSASADKKFAAAIVRPRVRCRPQLLVNVTVPDTNWPIIDEPACGDSVSALPFSQKSLSLIVPSEAVSVKSPAAVVVYVPESVEVELVSVSVQVQSDVPTQWTVIPGVGVAANSRFS